LNIPDIGKLVKKTDIALNRQMNQFAKKYDLTGVQMSIIDYLSRRPEHRAPQKNLENEFNIQRSTTTIILQRMEKRHLVVRQTNSQDRRIREVHLTEQAVALIPVVNDYINYHQKQLRQQFTSAELETVVKVLEALRRIDHE
jgi:MarR family transcriptional repressor of mepA